LKTLEQLFAHEVSLLYDCEHKTVKLLARMAARCGNAELVQVLSEYRRFSEKRLARLETVFGLIGGVPKRRPCAGMNGLITEFSDFVEAGPSPEILDVFAVESARRVERYSICAYQALITLAVALDLTDATELLAQSLSEHNLAGGGFKALSINLTERLLTAAAK
jgi:Mn-containing catalase